MYIGEYVLIITNLYNTNKSGESQKNRGASCCQQAPGIKMLFSL